MLENMPWLPWLIPPLIGALIGYVTNYIAIRMLFRPLRPWRLLGIRLPLTPGIIPAKRGELAQRMGKMVGSHLLTANDVSQTLEKPAFRRELKGAVNDKLRTFLDRELGSLETLIPEGYQQRFRELVATVRAKAVCAATDYLASDEFEEQLHDFIQEKGDALLARDLESFLTPSRYQSLQSHLDTRLTTVLRSPEAARTVERFVDDRLERLLQSDRSLRELLPQDLVEVLLHQLEREVPPLLERFGGLLYDPDSFIALEGLVDTWSFPEVERQRDALARHGVRTKFMNREAADWAGQVLELAEDGLRRIGDENDAGEDETVLLRPLRELLEASRCPADVLLDRVGDDVPSRDAVIRAAGL